MSTPPSAAPTRKASDFRFVTYGWDPAKAAALGDDEVGLLVYRSNLLGADLRITNFGGGNTSAKVLGPDPFDPDGKTDVLWVKGSGGDIGSLTRAGLASLDLGRLVALKRRYRGLAHEDEMVAMFRQCIVNANPTAPSIDTPLHGFLPYRHVDHLHPDAAIAIAAADNGEALTREIYGDDVAWVPWQRPGFDLALKLEAAAASRKGLRGLMLGGHGLFSWGDTSLACYENSLDLIERAAAYLDERDARIGSDRPFGPVVAGHEPLGPDARRARAAALAPVIRGIACRGMRNVGSFRDDDVVLDFIARDKAPALAAVGTSCPDHFLRTKIRPLLLDLPPSASVDDCTRRLHELAEDYARDYAAYYERCKFPDSPAMRGSNPAIVLLPGVGMWSFSRDAKQARIAGEFYVNAINVMRGAEAVSRYKGLPEKEAFGIEYWLLEEAKLRRMPKEKPLSRHTAFVTGGASGIGLACAVRFLEEGAAVVIADVNRERLDGAVAELVGRYGRDSVRGVVCDVRDPASVEAAFAEGLLAFGGFDIVVNNAGLSVSKGVVETTPEDWDLMNDVMPRGSFLVARAAVKAMRAQGGGGSIVYIVSKNALSAGPNNIAYGTAKAAQLHQMRLLAAEVGGDGIRVNAVNPDAVIRGSNIWSSGWAAGRAKAYGVKEEDLGKFYADRTILKQEVFPEDVAAAAFALSSDLFAKTTGATVNVDAGIAMAFVR